MSNEGENMAQRAVDGPGPFRISRSISPVQLASILLTILVSGTGAYTGFRSLEATVGQMGLEVKELSKQAASNNVINAVQDRNISDIDRRVTIIETQIRAGRMINSPPK